MFHAAPVNNPIVFYIYMSELCIVVSLLAFSQLGEYKYLFLIVILCAVLFLIFFLTTNSYNI